MLTLDQRKIILDVLESTFSQIEDFRTFLINKTGRHLDKIAIGDLATVQSRVVVDAEEKEWLIELVRALRETVGPGAQTKLDSLGAIEGFPAARVNRDRLVRGRVVNLVLTVLAVVLGWLWFNFHVKRYVTGWAFGGVSTIAAAAFAWGIWKAFTGDELKTLPQRWLAGKRTRVMLIALLLLVAAAHLLTASLHIDADPARVRDGGKIVASFARDSRTVKTVTLDAKHTEAALTFLVGTKPVAVDVVTKEPPGFEQEQVQVGRFVQTLTLPNAEREKSYNLVRLASGLYLFSLRTKQPDPAYDVEVWVNGNLVRTVDALGFQTFYIGGAAGDLKAVRNLHGSPQHRAQLDRFLRDLGVADARKRGEMTDDWLSDPVYLDTPELKPTDRVRVVVKRGAVVSFDQSIIPVQHAQLETTFLKGVPQQ